MVSTTSNPSIQISTSDYDGEAQEQPTREILNRFGIQGGVSVFLTTELPTYSGMTAISAGAVSVDDTATHVWLPGATQHVSPSFFKQKLIAFRHS